MLRSDDTFADYCAHAAMNCSKLMHGFTSMLALKTAIDGDYPDPTPAMIFGADYHKLILEPQEFRDHYVVMDNFALDSANEDAKGNPSTSWATKYCKQRKQEFILNAAEQGKEVIKREDFDRAVAMLAAIRSKPFARSIIEGCDTEITLVGEIAGIEFKGRVDLLGSHLADLKGTNTVNPYLFGSTATRLHYPERMAVYRELCRQNGHDHEDAWIIAVQTDKPFDVCVFPLRSHLLDEMLAKKVVLLIDRYKTARDTDTWPGVDGGEDYLEFHLPNWAMSDDDVLDWST